MLQAVIFDFDGLILDTETPEVRSWEEVFHHFGAIYPEWYWRFTLGRGAEQVAKRPFHLLEEQGVSAQEEEVLQMRGHVLARMLAELQILPGVRERMREAKDLSAKLGVASSSKHAWVDHHLERLGLLSEFDQIVCADDVARAKPFPDLYLECCRRLEIHPFSAVALEDSANGCQAAHDAGLYVIACPTHLTEAKALAAHQVVRSLAEIQLSQIELNSRG